MDADFTGSLKRVFGKTLLPVKLSTDINYDEVLERSLKKWKARTIPTTDEAFTLEKLAIAKSNYSNINLKPKQVKCLEAVYSNKDVIAVLF